MLEFQKKRKISQKLYSGITVIILVFVVVFLARASWDVFQKQKESEGDAKIVLERLNDLQNKEKTLRSQIEWLNTKTGTEEVIRQKFNVAKDGEKIVVIIDSDNKETTTPEKIEGSFLGDWLAQFTNLFR
ncbi:MAG: hypothetical protein HQ402_01460 [Parcubacteria group bacterium]|nr:hypothetical protein [Parcubacteria group bacterium]